MVLMYYNNVYDYGGFKHKLTTYHIPLNIFVLYFYFLKHLFNLLHVNNVVWNKS